MDDYELLLADRLGVIKEVNKKYGLEDNAYLSFSGGKDSTIVHFLFDMALPGNNIPRVFIDTGIEYLEIRKFVMEIANKDPRFVIIKPSKPIKAILDKYGYPFKSKEHSHFLSCYQHSGFGKSVNQYLKRDGESKLITCPNSLRYQFDPSFQIKIGDKCCLKLKKEPAKKYEKESGRNIAITGMRSEEGGQRMRIKGCVLTDGEGNLKKFHPLIVVSEDWEEEFVKRNSIPLCALYKEPYNFKRTGCKGCPFALNLEEQLEIMEIYMPNERKQCELIWKPVYDEYRRLDYRLKKNEQGRLF